MMVQGAYKRPRLINLPVVAASSTCGSSRPINAGRLKDFIVMIPVFPQ